MVITRGTTVTKTRYQCCTLCDDTGLNSYSFIAFFIIFITASPKAVAGPYSAPMTKITRATVQFAHADQQVNQQLNLCSTSVSFKMRQLKAKRGKKPLGSHSSFGASAGKQSPVPLCNSLHKQFEGNSLLDCYHYTSLGQKWQSKES